MTFKQLTKWRDRIGAYFADGPKDHVLETQNKGNSNRSRNKLARRSTVSAAGLHCNGQCLTSESQIHNVSPSFPRPAQSQRPNSRLSSLKRWTTVPSTSRPRSRRLSKLEASPVEDFDLDENYQKAAKKARRKLVRKSTLPKNSTSKRVAKNPVTGLSDEKLYQAQPPMPVSLSISTNVPQLRRSQSIYTNSSFVSSSHELPRSASSFNSQQTACFGRENYSSPNTPLTCLSAMSLPCEAKPCTTFSTVNSGIPSESPYRSRLSRPISYADIRTSLTPFEQEEFFSSALEANASGSLYPPSTFGVYGNHHMESCTTLRPAELAEEHDVLRQIPSPEQRIRRTPTTTTYRPGTIRRHSRSKSDPHMLDQFYAQAPSRSINRSRPQSMVTIKHPQPHVYYQAYPDAAYPLPSRPQSASSERTYQIYP